jgi:hypothetical protein
LKRHEKIKIMLNQARKMTLKLEKVIRVGSLIQKELSPNLITKLELDFCSADAESVLEYYDEIIEKK